METKTIMTTKEMQVTKKDELIKQNKNNEI